MIHNYPVYGIAVTAVAVGLYIWMRWWLSKAESARADRIEKIPEWSPIETEAPREVSDQHTRKRALASLGTRFSIVRRTFYLLLLCLWAVFIFVPVMGEAPATLVSLFVTAGAVIVGIAARPMVENFIAGFVVTFSKQFRTGDTVLIDKEYGTIEDITPTHTIIKLWDWRRYIVPNSRMLAKEIFNYSTRDRFLWAKLEFWVAHTADLKLVEEVAVDVARKHPLRLGNEDPQFWVMGMEKDCVKCWLAAWTGSPADAWTIRVELARDVTTGLKEKGIRPHTFIHHPVEAPGG